MCVCVCVCLCVLSIYIHLCTCIHTDTHIQTRTYPLGPNVTFLFFGFSLIYLSLRIRTIPYIGPFKEILYNYHINS